MFEADELKSKNDYLRGKYPDDFANFSGAEKNELYQRYVDDAKRAKEQFIANKYLEDQKYLKVAEPKTKAEREAAEDNRLYLLEQAMNKTEPNAQQQQQPQRQEPENVIQNNEPNLQNENPQVNQHVPLDERIKNNNGFVEINLDEEDELEVKEDEKVEEKNVAKEEEKVVEGGGERMDIDLDDDNVELNNDILNFGGKQTELDKDPLKK